MIFIWLNGGQSFIMTKTNDFFLNMRCIHYRLSESTYTYNHIILIIEMPEKNYLKRRQNLQGKTLRTIYYDDLGYCSALEPSPLHNNPRNRNWREHNWWGNIEHILCMAYKKTNSPPGLDRYQISIILWLTCWTSPTLSSSPGMAIGAAFMRFGFYMYEVYNPNVLEWNLEWRCWRHSCRCCGCRRSVFHCKLHKVNSGWL